MTYRAVMRSSNDRRRVLAESGGWATRQDAEILGVNQLRAVGWLCKRDQSQAVLCIEEEL